MNLYRSRLLSWLFIEDSWTLVTSPKKAKLIKFEIKLSFPNQHHVDIETQQRRIMKYFIKCAVTLTILLLLSSCTKFFNNDTQDKELEKAIFRTNNTREYYKIKTINKKQEQTFEPNKFGDIEASAKEFVADIDVEVKKNCYEMYAIKNDILPLCSGGDDPKYNTVENLKKAGTTIQMKDIKIRIKNVKNLKLKKEFKEYTIDYKNQTYYQL